VVDGEIGGGDAPDRRLLVHSRKSELDAIAWLLRAYQQGSPTVKDTLRKLGVNAE
jgi:hypothetical protein